MSVAVAPLKSFPGVKSAESKPLPSYPAPMGHTTDGLTTGRRRFLRTLGGAAVAGSVALAGCTSGGDGGDGSDGGDDGGEGPYDGWLADTGAFEGAPADLTGRPEVTVEVGAGDGFSFAPAAVRVSPDTTVVWEWTGRGSQHNVVAEDGAYESPFYRSVGRTFSHAFAESGVSKYYCAPHQPLGMKGVVEVE